MLDQSSVIWRYAGDARLVPFLGRVFLLHAAHPTIGAGVMDHSTFKSDPFGRLQHSWGRVLETLYAADGERIGAEVRAAHKQIKGTKPDGTRYHAYEPEASFWVLASGYETIVATARRIMRPMHPSDEARAYDETRELGRRFGLRDRDMPETLEEFNAWYGWMLAERLESNETVRDVFRVLKRPNPPQGLPELLWSLPRPLAARLGWLTTIGTLPPGLRERFDVGWGRADELQLAAIVRAFKALNAAPAHWFYLPTAREAFARTASSRATAESSVPDRVAA
jgi:uncharacterized protein (DUF2236 family)